MSKDLKIRLLVLLVFTVLYFGITALYALLLPFENVRVLMLANFIVSAGLTILLFKTKMRNIYYNGIAIIISICFMSALAMKVLASIGSEDFSILMTLLVLFLGYLNFGNYVEVAE